MKRLLTETFYLSGLVVLLVLLVGATPASAAHVPLHCVPQPTWGVKVPAHYSARLHKGRLIFAIDDAGKSMKWICSPLPGPQAAPYLLVKYRATGAVPEGMDYFLWGLDAGQGACLLPADKLIADGKTHTVCVDLTSFGLFGTQSVAVNLASLNSARLEIFKLELVETPPRDAVLFPGKVPEKTFTLQMEQLADFTPQPTWLANRASSHQVRRTASGWRFETSGVSLGMKWTCNLPADLDLGEYKFVTLRYRAKNCAAWSDYLFDFLQGSKEAKLFSGGDLLADGHWHYLVSPCNVYFTPTHVAVQLVAASGSAWLELDELTFSVGLPRLSLADSLQVDQAPASDAFTCLSLPGQGKPDRLEALLHSALFKDDLPKQRLVTEGVPFELAEGRFIATGLASETPASVKLSATGTELCLLMVTASTGFPRTPTNQVFARPACFKEAAAFGLKVRYADGTEDELLPYSLASRDWQFTGGADVYTVPLRPGRKVRELVLEDHLSNGALVLLGLSVNSGKPLGRRRAGPFPLVPECPLAKPARAFTPGFSLEGKRLVAHSTSLELILDLSKGVQVQGLRSVFAEPVKSEVGDLFEVRLEGEQLPSTRFKTGPVELSRTQAAVPVQYAGPRGALQGRLLLKPDGEYLDMRLELENVGPPARVQVVFPRFAGLALGKAGDTWYLLPDRALLLGRSAGTFSATRGATYPLQVIDFFNPKAGFGLALQTRDQKGLTWTCRTRKSPAGLDYSLETFSTTFSTGEQVPVPVTVIAAHPGGWREALGLYRKWVDTWYKPLAPRKRWFQDVYCFRQHFLSEGLYNHKTHAFDFDRALEADKQAFGCIDYLLLFDWSSTAKYGRVGDYEHFDALGGKANFNHALASVQQQGVPVGLYLEGYLIDTRSDIAEQARQWQLLAPDGSGKWWPGSTTEMFVCPNVQARRDYATGVYERLSHELAVNGLYIDEFGFADLGKVCYSKHHDHHVPEAPLGGELKMTRAIRKRMLPSVALYTEDWPVDLAMPLQDGAFSYAVMWANRATNPAGLHLVRFVFPDFKGIQLIQYGGFSNGKWKLAPKVFFNGEGIWLEGWATSAYDEPALAFLKHAFKVQHKYAEAFRSPAVTPLVPTLQPGLYANRFEAQDYTLWTLYNAAPYTLSGPLLKVQASGGRWVDAWQEHPARTVRLPGEDSVVVYGSVAPFNVDCLVHFQR